MSIVDDILIDKICKYYCEKFNLPFTEISKNDLLARSKRITQYLNTVETIVNRNLEAIKKPSFFEDLQFLLIGPAWLLHFIYKKLSIPY